MYKTANHHYSGGIGIFISLWIFFIEMGPPMSEKQVKESQSRVAAPILAQAGVGAWHYN